MTYALCKRRDEDEAYCALIGDQISTGLLDLRISCVGKTPSVPFIRDPPDGLRRRRLWFQCRDNCRIPDSSSVSESDVVGIRSKHYGHLE
jgi:hypothetical protein